MGTAHFTKRSLQEAYEMVYKKRPHDLAIELDLQRYKILNDRCITCPKRGYCQHRCEFIGAADALGNVDAFIWLIDYSEREIAQRIRGHMTTSEYANLTLLPRVFGSNISEAQLWEKGFKDLVVQRSSERLDKLKKWFPTIWKVLIDERNTVMAARLAWIVTKRLDEGVENPQCLALVGAAHVEGIRELLKSPVLIRDSLRRLDLHFSPPTPIRRISVN